MSVRRLGRCRWLSAATWLLSAAASGQSAATAVEPSPDGSIYVIHRCHANSCAGRAEPPILKYDASGKLLKSWGQGMFILPHGAAVVGGAVVRRQMLERHLKK